MRSILIMAAVFAALVVAFVVFLLTQKSSVPVARRGPTGTTLPTLTDTNSNSSFGAGEGGWVQSFDKKTGELASEFRAEHFDPPVDNVVHVTKPEARFYGHDGQILTLHAVDGDITMAETAKRPDRLGQMQSQPPSHGILRTVTLGLLETPEDDVAVLVATLPIVAFDNDLLRLNTVPWVQPDKKEIPADLVPVTVRGRDYDFDGQGLTIRYNQRDRKLELLEVAHGHRLVIKNPKAFGGTPGAALGAAPLQLNGRPIELASADDEVAPRMTAEERERRRLHREAATRRAAASQAALAPTKPPREVFAYRATFNDNVKIKEAAVPVGAADLMTAVFTFDADKKGTTQPSTQTAASQPVVAPTSTVPPTTRPARRIHATLPSDEPADAPIKHAVVQPTSQPVHRMAASAPTTSPTGPIEITWTGKLTVVPRKLVDSGLRSAADRIVEFTGKPVWLAREGSTVVAAYVWAAIEGQRFTATPDATTPRVTIHQATGTTLVTESIEADGDDVKLHGKSVADMVTGTAPDVQQMHTTWTDLATIRLTDNKDGKRGIERALFRGHVDVQHPQLKLTSDTLPLGFAPGEDGAEATLSLVRADGAVKAAVKKDDGTEQTIAASTLDLGLMPVAGGQPTLHTLHAHGDVVAQDTTQLLQTDDLQTTLAANTDSGATTAPTAAALEQLTATGKVRLTTSDGASSTADVLSIDHKAGRRWVTLNGSPATASNGDSTLSGNTIRADVTSAFDPSNSSGQSSATIDGPGHLSGKQKSADGKPSQPIDVTWTKSMVYDGPANHAKIDGGVVVTTKGTDGTNNYAKGSTLDIVFAEPSATQPAAAPATQGSGIAAIGGSGKVKSLTLHGAAGETVEVSSLLYAANDPAKLVRRTYLYAPLITVEVNPDGSPGAMHVPSGGQMLYDNLAAAPQPAAPANAAPANGAPAAGGQANSAGTVALEWARSMDYDPAKKQAVLDGDVHVVRDSPGSERMEIWAPRIIADVSGGAGPQGAQLQKITADNANMKAGQVSIDAPSAVYDPSKDLLIAKGTPRQPVQLHEEGNGMSRGSIGEIWWNVKTNQPVKMFDVTTEINR
ncbi:MAG: OstA-like protein [Phycisphaerales bacterium]|nr:OstA-like protein [Phycisphaerales bacterium]